jgi:hypothetical protein
MSHISSNFFRSDLSKALRNSFYSAFFIASAIRKEGIVLPFGETSPHSNPKTSSLLPLRLPNANRYRPQQLTESAIALSSVLIMYFENVNQESIDHLSGISTDRRRNCNRITKKVIKTSSIFGFLTYILIR